MTPEEKKRVKQAVIDGAKERGKKIFGCTVYHEAEVLDECYIEADNMENARNRAARTAWGYGWKGSPIVAILTNEM